MFTNIAIDWDSNRGSLSSEKINIHYQNLGSILEMVIIIEGLKTGWLCCIATYERLTIQATY
ncbi:hypothetical protein [Wolbachia endosymbiont (group B) of Horisme vitalbata]|uniref:hypothetical protein n=1 Tax=Wolbachia endosymbiont (group B) of Horisme vitalbata TaxID=3066178 RepID=UPI0033414A61